MKVSRSITAIALAGLLAACGETTVSSTPEKREEGGGTSGGSGKAVAGVGDSLKLSGNEEGLAIQTTLLKVMDPVHSTNQFLKPLKGNRFVALQVELVNIGDIVYKDSPSNGAVVVDHQSQQYNASVVGVEPDLGTPTIATGDKRVGLLTFEVPKKAKLRTFQFTLESGFGPEAGEWKL